MKKPRLLGVVCASILISITTNVDAVAFTLTDLGSLGGSSYAYGINNIGQVVGTSPILGHDHAFLWTAGTGINDLGLDSSTAYAINDSGTIVGSTGAQAFYGSDGSYSITNPMSELSQTAYDINNQGTALVSGAFGLQKQSFLWNGTDSFTAITATAHGINNNNAAVGQVSSSPTFPTNNSAFVYDEGITNIIIPNGRAFDISDTGYVVGLYWPSNVGATSTPFIWKDGVGFTAIDNLFGIGSRAYAVNNDGTVVGSANLPTGGSHAFLYQDGSLNDLNSMIDPSSGWILADARDINELGQIVGWGTINGDTRAYLLTPTAIPIPAAAWLFGSGLLGLVGAARKKKRA